jgi:hypothetical protein
MIVPILSPSDPHLNTRDGDKVSIGKLTLEAQSVQEVLDRSNTEIGYEHLKSQCFSVDSNSIVVAQHNKIPQRKHIDLV